MPNPDRLEQYLQGPRRLREYQSTRGFREHRNLMEQAPGEDQAPDPEASQARDPRGPRLSATIGEIVLWKWRSQGFDILNPATTPRTGSNRRRRLFVDVREALRELTSESNNGQKSRPRVSWHKLRPQEGLAERRRVYLGLVEWRDGKFTFTEFTGPARAEMVGREARKLAPGDEAVPSYLDSALTVLVKNASDPGFSAELLSRKQVNLNGVDYPLVRCPLPQSIGIERPIEKPPSLNGTEAVFAMVSRGRTDGIAVLGFFDGNRIDQSLKDRSAKNTSPLALLNSLSIAR